MIRVHLLSLNLAGICYIPLSRIALIPLDYALKWTLCRPIIVVLWGILWRVKKVKVGWDVREIGSPFKIINIVCLYLLGG